MKFIQFKLYTLEDLEILSGLDRHIVQEEGTSRPKEVVWIHVRLQPEKSVYNPGLCVNQKGDPQTRRSGIKKGCMCVCVKLLHLRLTLCDLKGGNPLGSSVHGILQARILEWVTISSFRGSS